MSQEPSSIGIIANEHQVGQPQSTNSDPIFEHQTWFPDQGAPDPAQTWKTEDARREATRKLVLELAGQSQQAQPTESGREAKLHLAHELGFSPVPPREDGEPDGRRHQTAPDHKSQSISIDTILDALRQHNCNPVKQGKGWRANCPAHDDKDPSLDIDIGDNGSPLLFCQSQHCRYEEILKAIGLGRSGRNGRQSGQSKTSRKNDKPKRPYPSPEAAIARTVSQLGQPTGPWIYREDDQSESFRIYRFDPAGKAKTCRPVHPGAGGWYFGDPPGILSIYNKPDLAAADLVFVTEGEKCAELTKNLGLVATTSSHGALSAGRSDWSPLAGKNVVILPDHDENGERYAADVAGLLSKLEPPAQVKILRLPLKEKGDDIAEWLESLPDSWGPENCRDKLLELVETAPEPLLAELVATKTAVGYQEHLLATLGATKAAVVYHEEDGQLFYGARRLANFTARITKTIIHHENDEETTLFDITATCHTGRSRSIVLPSDKFKSMNWTFALGSEFAINPGKDTADYARHAIQILSPVAVTHEHTSLGWIKHDGQWLYLHAGGAIGKVDSSTTISMEVHGSLASYRLPDPTNDRLLLEQAWRRSRRHLVPSQSWSPRRLCRRGCTGSSVLKCEAWDFSVFCRSQSFC